MKTTRNGWRPRRRLDGEFPASPREGVLQFVRRREARGRAITRPDAP